MKKKDDGLIPMDDAIKDFENHLKGHPRTILSAKYGDGKSVFLSAVEKKLKSKYVFLKLYPVNYQVEENQGIFDYIKRDLLFQLYGQGMVPDEYVIPDEIASYFFLQSNWDEFAKETLQCLSYLDASNTTKATLGALKFLVSMREKYKEYKEFRDNGGDRGVILDKFLSAFNKKGIYEADPMTGILCDIVETWKRNHPKKKICLIFEDMDRIDPAHIFRILNVVSAHMDYGYKYGVSPVNTSLSGNKFGVDNIVICLDYNNLHHIYSHFYGPDACFDGYIGKFSDKGFFPYSIKALAQQHYTNHLVPVTDMDAIAVYEILSRLDLMKYTLRELYHAVEDVETQIDMPKGSDGVFPHKGLFVMAAIFTRLGIPKDKIVSILSDSFRKNPLELGRFLGSSMLLRRKMGIDEPFEFTLGERLNNGILGYQISGCQRDGQVKVDRRKLTSGNLQAISPEEEMEFVMNAVLK